MSHVTHPPSIGEKIARDATERLCAEVLAKRLRFRRIKFPIHTIFARLVAERDYEASRGAAHLYPTSSSERCVNRSVRGDKAYYAWRGKRIEEAVTDTRFSPAERMAALGLLSRTTPKS